MIRSFRNKALHQLFDGNPKRIESSLRRKIENILFTLSAASDVQAMNLPGYRLHPLSGKNAGPLGGSDQWQLADHFPV